MSRWMNHLFFDRSVGALAPKSFSRTIASQQVNSILPASQLQFNGGEAASAADNEKESSADVATWSHKSGVTAIAIDRFEGKILLSGGADASIKIWSLEGLPYGRAAHSLNPAGTIHRSALSHKFGITHLSFYPFDSAAFLSSSYDHHLKLYSTETLQLSADFDLRSIVYTHAISPIAHHLTVACATQHTTVRLIDLRSGLSTHSLAGHNGALLSVAWSPTVEHVLASGSIDGTVRLWDIRKSSGSLGVLDMEDLTGITGFNSMGHGARSRERGKSHNGAVNGLTWTEDGAYIISAGQDERVRVWNAATGANTLASFGPTLKNSHLSNLPIVVSPTHLTPPGKELLFYPNEKELLIFEMHQGRLLKRLKVPGRGTASIRSSTGESITANRMTAMAWRAPFDGIYSAHTDGQIRAWLPWTAEDEAVAREEESEHKVGRDHDESGGKRKRKALDDVFRDLTRQKITFG